MDEDRAHLQAGYALPALAAAGNAPRTGFQNHRVFGNILDEAKVQPRVTFLSEAIRAAILIDTPMKVLGDASRWPEIAELNGIDADIPYRLGQCPALPE